MSDDLETLQRRAGHRRGHSVPLRNRAAVDRGLDTGAGGADSSSFIRVSDHVPDGGELTDANFEAALRAAILAGYAFVGSPESNQKGGIAILIPTGVWDLSNITESIKFPGTFPKYTPSLVGEGGAGTVVLVMPQNLYPWLELGTDDPNADNVLFNNVSNQVIKNIEFRPLGGVANKGGIRSYASIRCTFEDVLVSGLRDTVPSGPIWHECIAYDFNGVSGTNHQHLRMTRCVSDYNLIGFRFGETTWSVTMVDCHVNGNIVAPVIYEGGAVVTWLGGNSQSGPDGSPTAWYGGNRQAVHCSGVNHTAGLPSGTGASVSTPSGRFSTVTGLTLMKGSALGDNLTYKGSWLEVNGGQLYRIEEVLSATSCTIQRAVGGALSNVVYQVRASTGGVNVHLNGIYHEGGAYALASFGPDGASSSRITIDSCEANNCDVVAEITACQGSVHVTNTVAPGQLYGKLRHCQKFTTDGDISAIDADTFSRIGLVARKNGSLYDARPSAARYNRALKERGAIFAVDARKTSSFSMSAPNITTWTDFIGGVVGARLNAGVAPQYVVSDANLGAPAVQLTGGASAAAIGGFQWDLTSKFRTPRAGGTVIAVGRLPNTTPDANNRLIRLSAQGPFEISLGYNDAQFFPTGSYGVIYSDDIGGGGAASAVAAPNDTAGHVIVVSSLMLNPVGGNFGSAGACASDTADHIPNANFGCFGIRDGATFATPSVSPTLLRAPWYLFGTIGDIYISHLAVFDRGLGMFEVEQLIDLVRNEFNITKS